MRISSKGKFKNRFLIVVLACAFTLLSLSQALSWGPKTHRLINETALLSLPADFPSFLREEKVWILYQAPEPDRWKEKYAYTLKKDTSPEHYLNLEKIQKSDIRKDRFSYMTALQKRNLDLDEVGFLPFTIIETYQKLLVSLKEYGKSQSDEETKVIERNIAYYAGLLGHYVGDGSMPLHLTIHFDGWQGENPKGFATSNVHGPVESYADTIVSLNGLLSLISSPKILENPFDDVIEYLYASNTKVEELYELHKEGALKKNPVNPKGKEFISKSVSRGSQMLLNLWYTAYIKSKEE